MTATTTTLDKALKEYYLPPAREQLNNENMMLAQIERTTQHVEGREAVLSLHVGRNSGIGARAEGGELPTAGNQQYIDARVGLAYNYLRIRVSGQAMKATANDSSHSIFNGLLCTQTQLQLKLISSKLVCELMSVR